MERIRQVRTVDFEAVQRNADVSVREAPEGVTFRALAVHAIDSKPKTVAKALYEAWLVSGRPRPGRAFFFRNDGTQIFPSTSAGDFVEIPCVRKGANFGGEFLFLDEKAVTHGR